MKHAVRLALALGLLLGAGAVSAADDTSTPVGTWKQVDDVTGKPTSILQITESNGELQARVLQVMNATPEDVARDGNPPKCTQCDGARKDQPIIGMTIMWGVSKDGDVWDGGRILDPKSGKTYKVKLTLKDAGRKLDVHGYIGFALLGRSQTWDRQQ
ncbi:DUF2147 domain-containing protein [Rhodanobacter sp. DHB23]|uniref:DUF2147 domain-containing protein n=1 Tax=Rhodanobacter sp. DHB23 TaxID=2775923 RepID=UPI001782E986|nr:DUF2147 domain-containing protein [Rhodanobacter sp. DHB23]MBD8871619.1 DUF2147 domain-containing protein [Rhodanobacter sp. DHB23]